MDTNIKPIVVKDCNDCVMHIQGGPIPSLCNQCLTITEGTFGEATQLPFFMSIATPEQLQGQYSISGKGVDSTKLTNPKDAIGSSKLPMNLVPDTLGVYAALAFTEGAAKYGSYNWRVAGVRSSIYRAALQRHLMKWWNGEDVDLSTGVPHLASVIACAGILLDAELAGKLTDDRPPKVPMSRLIDSLELNVKVLLELHRDKKPHHHTANDGAV